MKTESAEATSSRNRMPATAALIFLTALVALIVGVVGIQVVLAAPAETVKPISLDPQNPHYFLFRGRPTVLITSTEHYGSVMNADFYYPLYLNELQSHGFNLTRLFSGVYVEDFAAFKIARNTLAPAPLRFLCPWARSSQPGYAGGGNKFDLHTWDPAYFHRLKDFVAQAGKRGIVVEMVLFCPYYGDSQWDLSPIKASNNIQGIGDLPRTKALTLDNGPLLAIQDAMVRKFVTELRDFDNVYYEICNEPYFGGVTIPWQNHVAETIKSTEAAFPVKHLIAQNISNVSKKIENPNPSVSIFNFHYSRPPKSVAMNFGLNRVISDDETGFRGTGDSPYRREGWDFILAGGGRRGTGARAGDAGAGAGGSRARVPGHGHQPVLAVTMLDRVDQQIPQDPPDPPRIHVDDAARLTLPSLRVPAGVTIVVDDRALAAQ